MKSLYKNFCSRFFVPTAPSHLLSSATLGILLFLSLFSVIDKHYTNRGHLSLLIALPHCENWSIRGITYCVLSSIKLYLTTVFNSVNLWEYFVSGDNINYFWKAVIGAFAQSLLEKQNNQPDMYCSHG